MIAVSVQGTGGGEGDATTFITTYYTTDYNDILSVYSTRLLLGFSTTISKSYHFKTKSLKQFKRNCNLKIFPNIKQKV